MVNWFSDCKTSTYIPYCRRATPNVPSSYVYIATYQGQFTMARNNSA